MNVLICLEIAERLLCSRSTQERSSRSAWHVLIVMIAIDTVVSFHTFCKEIDVQYGDDDPNSVASASSPFSLELRLFLTA